MNKIVNESKYECFYCGDIEKIKFAADTYPYDIGNDEERDYVMVHKGDPLCDSGGCGALVPVKEGKAKRMQEIMDRISQEIESGIRDEDGVPHRIWEKYH